MQTYDVKVSEKFYKIRAKSIDTLRKRLISELKDGYFVTATVRMIDGSTGILEVQHGGYARWYGNVRFLPNGTFTWDKAYEVKSNGSLGARRY